MAIIIGLHIGESFIKACLIDKTLAGWKFLEYRDIYFETKPDEDDYINALKNMFSAEERFSGVFYTALQGTDIYYRLTEIPFNDTRRIQKTVEVELDSELPIPLEELIVTYTPASRKDTSNRVLGYGIRKEKLKQYLNILGNAGIDPVVVDWDALSLYTYSHKILPEGDGISLIIDVDRDDARLCFYSSGGIELIRSIKINDGEIAGEIRKSERMLWNLTNKKIQRIYLSAGSNSAEIAERTGREMDIPVEPLKPSRLFPELEQIPISKEFNAVLPVAVALRGIYRKTLAGNFRIGEFAYRKALSEMKSSLTIAGAVLGVLVILIIGDVIYKYGDRKNVLNRLQSEITKICSGVIKGYAPDMDCAKELRKRYAGNSIRLYSKIKVIDFLRELSIRIPPSYTVDITEITQEGEKVRLKGKVPTLDTMDKIKTELSRSSYFHNVEVVDSKQDIDGKSFNFIINLMLKEETG